MKKFIFILAGLIIFVVGVSEHKVNAAVAPKVINGNTTVNDNKGFYTPVFRASYAWNYSFYSYCEKDTGTIYGQVERKEADGKYITTGPKFEISCGHPKNINFFHKEWVTYYSTTDYRIHIQNETADANAWAHIKYEIHYY
ncbi:hypothetical protein BM86_33580 [Bacillus thuringiensis]|uniref:Uncharacterized protein n=1 Tax=Bacillus thuringiensis TaxID=1428 RepID=A0A9W3SGR5_BACTU|nr:hypothetical protein [Bacillus thuringiensis]ANS50846.1 hypothetical protein BT246_55480 [Bacillus thuringiensis]MBH0340239.1 hypothetical protein [Bacillus thuringiensis]